MKEIERKYLAAFSRGQLDLQQIDEYLLVEQAYVLVTKRAEWRIRHTSYNKHPKYTEPRCYTALKFGNGFVRREYEWHIPIAVYRFLRRFTGQRLLKERFKLNGWELDHFHGDLTGLQLAECEVPTEDTPFPTLPSMIQLRREVTDSGEFANKRLCRLTRPRARAMVEAILERA